MNVYLSADHAGFALKEVLLGFLDELGYGVVDCGAYKFDKEDDYPDFISDASRKLSADALNGKESRAIIIGGSGQGEAICANRFKGVRAVVYYGGNDEIIRLSRDHNNANALALGARFISENETKVVVKKWLETPFSGQERHKRRIEKIDKIS